MRKGNFYYSIDSNESPTIITFGQRVTNIGASLNRDLNEERFLGEEVRFVIPDNVTKIGPRGFANFSFTIEELVIPNSIKTIGSFAFDSCTGLKKIVIPNSISEICDETFCKCTSLQEVIFPDSLQSIGRLAFKDCTSLEKIFIPDSVEQISSAMFLGCSGLKEISIPEHLEKYGIDFIRYDTNANVVVRKLANNLSTDSTNKSNNSCVKSYCGVVRDNLLKKKK